MKWLLLGSLPVVAFSFLLPSVSFHPRTIGGMSSPDGGTMNENDDTNNSNDDAETPKLVLDGIGEQMAQLTSKYPTSESAYLAAARERAQRKQASVEQSAATDEDWQRIAQEKKAQMGDLDDWENSQKEAGNMDSQILMHLSGMEGDDSADDDEPKLLLF